MESDRDVVLETRGPRNYPVAHSSATSGRKKWKTKDGVYQLKDPEKPEQAVPATDDACFGMCERQLLVGLRR